MARYLSIGDIYYYEHQFDSAKAYFKQVYDSTKNPDGKMLAVDRLREISLAEGDTLKANGYAMVLSQFATEKDKEGNLNSDLTTLCQQYEQGRQEAQHKMKIQKATKRWFIALGLAAFVVAVTSLLLLMLRTSIATTLIQLLLMDSTISPRQEYTPFSQTIQTTSLIFMFLDVNGCPTGLHGMLTETSSMSIQITTPFRIMKCSLKSIMPLTIMLCLIIQTFR